MSLVHEVTGMVGIHVLRALAIVLLLAFLQLTAAVYTTPVRAAGVALPAVVATAAQWGERPQLAGLVLLAATTWLWSRARRDATVPWLVDPADLALGDGARLVGARGRHRGARSWSRCSSSSPARARPWGRLVGVVAAAAGRRWADTTGAVAAAQAPSPSGPPRAGRVNEWAAPSPANPLVRRSWC